MNQVEQYLMARSINESLTNNQKLTIVGSVVMQAPQVQAPRKQVLLPNQHQDEGRRVLVAYQPITYSQRLVKPLTPFRWIKVRRGRMSLNPGSKRHFRSSH